MRAAIAFAAMLATASLGGCSTVPSVFGGQTQTIAYAEKALTLAHLAYQAVGVSLKAAAESGALHGADAATAKVLYDRAGGMLDAADQADALANADDVLSGVASAGALIAQINALIPK